ncbi:hypothetical protein HSBAA_21820 [Vreelandella sulfidaeris]|uniref:Peptidase M10 serralysin C-terminal domain-containing protein n=1 Tax=Vreelandella sulfidaeris TaxID=115553 RepID=A0A455U492_9GAMM|nr:hypothetical protein HSBAA_21820 [Halomonas sulfidaeris]
MRAAPSTTPLTGDADDNVIDGGAGADAMAGGQGDDTYMVDNVGDQVSEATDAGSDTVHSSRQLHPRQQCREPSARRDSEH